MSKEELINARCSLVASAISVARELDAETELDAPGMSYLVGCLIRDADEYVRLRDAQKEGLKDVPLVRRKTSVGRPSPSPETMIP